MSEHVPIEVLRRNQERNRKEMLKWIEAGKRKAAKRTPEETKQLMEKLAKL